MTSSLKQREYMYCIVVAHIVSPRPNTEGADERGRDAQESEGMDDLDERGRGTQESVGVCLALGKEIKERLEGDPHNTGLLWRLARVLTHQSMHNQDDADTEKELLHEGEYIYIAMR